MNKQNIEALTMLVCGIVLGICVRQSIYDYETKHLNDDLDELIRDFNPSKNKGGVLTRTLFFHINKKKETSK